MEWWEHPSCFGDVDTRIDEINHRQAMQRKASDELSRVDREIEEKLGRFQVHQNGLHETMDMRLREELATLRREQEAKHEEHPNKLREALEALDANLRRELANVSDATETQVGRHSLQLRGALDELEVKYGDGVSSLTVIHFGISTQQHTTWRRTNTLTQ